MVDELQRLREDEVGVPGARAWVVGTVIAPFHGHGMHAGSACGLDVAQVVADSSSTAAARNSGAGCGFVCGVVSPQTTQSGPNSSVFKIRSVKRVALLVTIPQAMSWLSSSRSSSAMPGNSRVSTQTRSAYLSRNASRSAG